MTIEPKPFAPVCDSVQRMSQPTKPQEQRFQNIISPGKICPVTFRVIDEVLALNTVINDTDRSCSNL
jgi:hypothetical protein